jgi:hypothetical protein
MPRMRRFFPTRSENEGKKLSYDIVAGELLCISRRVREYI